MHPQLFRIPLPFATYPVNSYGTLVILGMAAGIGYGCLRARRHGVTRFDVFALGMMTIAGGLVGAWLLFLIINFPDFLRQPLAYVQSPGMVWYGGFIGGVAAGLVYVRGYRLPLGALGDVAAPALPLGHAFGRVGCFCGGCCYGHATSSPLGVTFTDPRALATTLCDRVGAIHPVQLYEAAGLVTIAVVVALLGRTPLLRRQTGALFPLYILLYALLRLTTEQFRGDVVERKFLIPGLISTSQAVAIGMVALAAGLLWAVRRRPATAGVA